MRRVAFWLLVLCTAAATAGTVWFAYALCGDMVDNRTIRLFHAGNEAEMRDGADPRVAYARALFLAWRDRVAEAEVLAPMLGDAPPDLWSGYHLAIGNARMRTAFEFIETSRLEEAVPEVELAKRAYRDALRASPGNYDAKVNLDLASRLVRDMPREGQEGSEETDRQPRRVWTDLPGLPRGEP